MKRLSIVVAVVAPLLLLLVLGSATANPTARRVKQVSRPIAAVAMDGPRLAYVTDDNGVRVWNVRTGATTQLRGGAGRYMNYPLIPEVAIAGTRVAWITVSINGNSLETWARLYARSLSDRTAKRVESAFRRDGIGDGTVEIWDGNWLTGLVGSGNVLALSRWTTTPTADLRGMRISRQRLSVLDPRRPVLRVIATGDRSIASASADRGRVAVLRTDDTVGIYSAAGALLKQITPTSAQEIAYGGDRLVVLTHAKTLEVYDAKSGALLHTWPVHTKAPYLQPGNLRAYGRIALYFADSRRLVQRMHLVDLATGKELVLPPNSHPGASANAAVGPLGVVYSVNTYRYGSNPKRAGTLVFEPTARVLALIRRG
ncbi:MAG TPA: hypothetical protein VFK71_01420 [Gaiellaceae bacterium]|nr:hypothetical protein [Gaiellaceae bacterium]